MLSLAVKRHAGIHIRKIGDCLTQDHLTQILQDFVPVSAVAHGAEMRNEPQPKPRLTRDWGCRTYLVLGLFRKRIRFLLRKFGQFERSQGENGQAVRSSMRFHRGILEDLPFLRIVSLVSGPAVAKRLGTRMYPRALGTRILDIGDDPKETLRNTCLCHGRVRPGKRIN
jgi:hypothetical protein